MFYPRHYPRAYTRDAAATEPGAEDKSKAQNGDGAGAEPGAADEKKGKATSKDDSKSPAGGGTGPAKAAAGEKTTSVADRLEAEAVKAEKAAVDAATSAKDARMKANAARAEAQGHVLVDVPASFQINERVTDETGKFLRYELHEIKKGTLTLPRAVAEHVYAKNHGVRILGLPTEALK